VDWELLVAGPVASDISAAHGAFLKDPRVKLLGTLRRAELRREMMSAPVFVFPSFAEGSARVVFEALACGCYVVTTPNAGTIVEDSVHGALVRPGDADQLRAAIAGANAQRPLVARIGNRNAQVVAERYRQSDYGDALAALYRKLTTRDVSDVSSPVAHGTEEDVGRPEQRMEPGRPGGNRGN
jgi:glycosyltransferase involved in cell wall biosynthesis